MELRCDATHLFPSCVPHGERPDGAAAVVLRFTDGITVEAELLDGGPSGEDLALAVPAYRTAAGTAITERVWTLRIDDRIRVGRRVR